MPASVTDRYTVDFEKMFFFTKNKKYYFKQQFEPITESSLKRAEYGWDGVVVEGIGRNSPKKTGKMGDRWVNPKGRNKRTVWSINTASFKDAHFAVYPPDLIEVPIDAGCPEGGVVLDPFFGSGTTAEVAMKQDKNWVGIELNGDYEKISKKRLKPTIKEKKTREKASEFWE